MLLRFVPALQRRGQHAQQARRRAERCGVRTEHDVSLGVGQEQLEELGRSRRVAEPDTDFGEVCDARDPDCIVRNARKSVSRELLEKFVGLVACTQFAMQDRQARSPRRDLRSR